MSASNYTIENIQKALYDGTAFPLPAGHFLGLHSGDPGGTGLSLEFSGNGYARKSFSPAIGASPTFIASNDAGVLFTADGGNWLEATYFSVWDSLSGGNMLDYSSIGVPFTLLDTKSVIVNTGDLTMNQS